MTAFSVAGTIRIDPPLNWQGIQHSPFLPNGWAGADRGRSLALVLDDAGAVGITCRYDETSDPDEMAAELQSIVDDRPNHQYIGFIGVEGEERDDLRRLIVVDGKATTAYAEVTVVWPEGSE